MSDQTRANLDGEDQDGPAPPSEVGGSDHAPADDGSADAPESTPEESGVSGRRRTRRVRTPTVLQMEAVECGAAALGIVLGYHGRHVPLEKLRVDCGVSRDGSNAANVMSAGEQYGLHARAFKMEPDDLKQTVMPAIIFWEFNHFLVIEGFGRGRAYLNDPAYGRREVTDAEFDKSFSGIVLTFEKTPAFQRGGRRPGIVKGLAKRFKSVHGAVTFCVLAGLGLVIPGLAVPTFAKVFVDDILIGRFQNWLVPLLLGMAATAVIRAALTSLQQYYLTRASTKLAITSTGKFLWHVLRLPTEFFMQRYAGDISSRVSSNDRVAQLLTGDLATSTIGVITAVFYGALMLWYDATLTAVGVGLALVNLVALRMVATRRADESQRLLQESGKLMATSMGGLQIIESIKATGREGDFFARWAGFQAKADGAEQRLRVSSAFLDTIPPSLSVLTMAIILGLGGLKVMDGTMTVGMLVAFMSLMGSFSQPIQELVRLGSVIQEVEGDMKRLDDVANYPVDPAFTSEPTGVTMSSATRRLNGFLELRNVTFGYNRLGEPLLKDFSLSLTPGDRVALVGTSGSGKSTVAKLVAGLYRPWSGQILYDGSAREKLPRDFLANSVAMVDQDIFFFEGSVRENVSLWDGTIPDEAIHRATKDACIHDRISTRRGAYGSLIEEGGRNFSGGQRQRLEIARALAIDPTILVMDEATSALDPATEKLVDDNIRRRGCTCLVVAHRLSTIRDASEIIVMDKGNVVQRGTHEELIRADGPYARLIKTE